jgi:hypothetical protein
MMDFLPREIWGVITLLCQRRTVSREASGLMFQLLSLGCVNKTLFQITNPEVILRYSYLCTSSAGFCQKFTSLTELKLYGDSEPKNFEHLWCLTNLRRLEVARFPVELPLPPLPNLEHLQTEDFSFHRCVEFPKLTSLVVGMLDRDRFTAVPQLSSLYIKTLVGCGDLDPASSIAQMTNLTRLRSKEMSFEPSLLMNLTNLTALETSGEDGDGIDLLLTTLKDIKSITIYPPISLTRYTHLTSLEKLCLSYNMFPPFYPITKFQHLRTFTNYCADFPGELVPLLTNLTSLKLRSATLLAEHIPSSLTKFVIYDSPKVTTLSHLTNLKVLDIDLPGRNHDYLSKLTNITDLRIRHKAQGDYPFTKLTNLTELTFFHSISIDEVLACLPKLRHVTMEEGYVRKGFTFGL